MEKKYNILFITLIFILSLCFLNIVMPDPDYYWHIKSGNYIFNNGFLTKDIYSWFLKGEYWYTHEWLAELIIYIYKLLFRNMHILIYTFTNLFILNMIIYKYNKETYFNNKLFFLIWTFLSIILLPFMQVRPHMLSNILLAITLYVLYKYYKKETKLIYIIPIISIIWANIHGGSSNLVYIFTFIFFICSLINFKSKCIETNKLDKKRIKTYFIIFILSILSLNINPHFYKIIIYPYININDNLMLNTITEWQKTSIFNISHILYFILIFIILFIIIKAKKKIKLIDLLLLMISIYLGYKAIRFWSYTYIISSFYISNYINKRKDDKYLKELIILIILLLTTLLIYSIPNIYNNSKIKYDYKLINIIKHEKPKRLYNAYDYGGILIYNDIEVFIDGRCDLYSKKNLKDYLDISKMNNNYKELLNKYNFDYYLVYKDQVINNYLKKYKIIYENKELILYKKDK